MTGVESPRAPEDDQAIRLTDSEPRRSTSSSGSSDLAYIDHLEVEPFPEKDVRFEDEPQMEYGGEEDDGDEAQGFVSDQRRASGALKPCRLGSHHLGQACKAGESGAGGASLRDCFRCCYWDLFSVPFHSAYLLQEERKKTHHYGPHLQRDVLCEDEAAELGS